MARASYTQGQYLYSRQIGLSVHIYLIAFLISFDDFIEYDHSQCLLYEGLACLLMLSRSFRLYTSLPFSLVLIISWTLSRASYTKG